MLHVRSRPALSRVAVLGHGAIGQTLVDRLLDSVTFGTNLSLLVYVKAHRIDELRARYAKRIQLTTSLDEVISFAPKVVVEAAGQPAVRELAEPILAAGHDLMLVSTGALVDEELKARLTATASSSGARMLIPAGAIAGLDGLGALRYSRDLRVRYVSVKPPNAWRGTPAEAAIDLDAVRSPVTFFRGSAAEAATRFPRNANLAATIAIAGAGLQRTTVELVADPNASGNRGWFEAEGELGRLTVELAGPSMSSNAKTSAVTAYSILHALENMDRTIVI
ncbi:aspartate dehydrogenase [Bradyrhizobium sp. SYSU BS000235]|uniref:aspartate dehydrogenase n=1 Tax=Bradyrhizobium sp. SYSU BS000235 TaxID=3411332 RepID=UPI003C7384E0